MSKKVMTKLFEAAIVLFSALHHGEEPHPRHEEEVSHLVHAEKGERSLYVSW